MSTLFKNCFLCHILLSLITLFLWSQTAIAVFEPILIDDDNNHRIWKITGADRFSDLTGKNLHDGIAPDIVQVGTYSLGYNIQDLATDDYGKTWALAMGTGLDGSTAGHAYIGRIIESMGVYSFTNPVDLGDTYNDPQHKNHGKALVWDTDNQYFIYEANPTQSDSLKATFKAYDPVTEMVVADPWGTGNPEMVIPLPLAQVHTYAQGLAFGPDQQLYAIIGVTPSILLRLERNANHQLTGDSTLIGSAGLGIGLNNLEVLTFTPSGKLLVVQSNGSSTSSSNKGKAFTVDLATGVPTEVADLDDGTALHLDWEGIHFFTPAEPFECTTDSYLFMSQSGSSSPTEGVSIDLTSGVATAVNSGNSFHPTNINAIGHNIKDGFIWGYDRPNNKVVRVDKNYNVISYNIAGLPTNSYHTGDVSPEGILYLAELYIDSGKIHKVNIDPASVDYLQYVGAVTLNPNPYNTFFNAKSIADFAFHPSDGHIYAVGVNNKLYKINPTTGLVTEVGAIGISLSANPNATWFDRDGYFYFNGNATTIYRIDLTNTSSPNTTAASFSTLAVPSEGDAARCAQAALVPETTVAKCFAMTDNVAELYSFDLNKNTPATKVNTTMLLNGEGATYRASENAIYTFHQSILGVDNPSDLYKVTMNGAVTLIKASFLDKQGVGAEFIHYSDGSERLMVLTPQNHSRLQMYDAQNLTSNTPLSSIPLLFPDGSDAYVAGLAVNPITGEILVVDDRHDNEDFVEIYSVDTSTGQLTLKITLTVPGIDAESLAFAEDGYLYTESDKGNPLPAYHNKIFRIDLSTGNIIAVEENIDVVVSGDIEGMSCTGSKIITQLPPPASIPPPPIGCNALSNDINAGLSTPQRLKSGEKLFLGATTVATKTGHLKAFSIDSSGLPSGSLLWDAALQMTGVERENRLYSTDASGNVETITNLPAADFATDAATVTTLKSVLYTSALGVLSANSNLTLIGNQSDTLNYLSDPYYRSYYTNSVSGRSKRILASSDDGFLYAFNQSDGDLGWGWMPRSLVAELKNGNAFNDQHHMRGNIDFLDLRDSSTSYKSYIIGSYKQGLGQYVLRLNNDTSSDLNAVVWDEDLSTSKVSAPNNGKRAYFKDGSKMVYTVYIATGSTANSSTLYIRNVTNNTAPLQVALPFTATSTPYIVGDSSNATTKTLYLGDNVGNIYSASLLQTNGNLQNSSNILSAITSVVTTLDSNASDAILYIGSVQSSANNKHYLRAQSDSRLTLFNYDTTNSTWIRIWSSYVAGSNKWNNGASEADSSITALPSNAHITDNAYIVADSIVLPVTLDPVNNACYGLSYYYFFKLDNGYFPTNTFYTTNATPTMISSSIALGSGQAKTLHLTNLLGSDKLQGFGMADQDLNGNAEINTSFTIRDPFTTGIRSWRELR